MSENLQVKNIIINDSTWCFNALHITRFKDILQFAGSSSPYSLQNGSNYKLVVRFVHTIHILHMN